MDTSPGRTRACIAEAEDYLPRVLRLVGRSVRRARGGVILKSTTTKGGLL
jgi:hypothetical protein